MDSGAAPEIAPWSPQLQKLKLFTIIYVVLWVAMFVVTNVETIQAIQADKQLQISAPLSSRIANAGQQNQATTTEAWRTSLVEFEKEVGVIAAKSKIINPSTVGIRNCLVLRDAKGENIGVIFKEGFSNEFHWKLAKQFSGLVSWHGLVDSLKTNSKDKVHIIKVKFPAANGMPKGIKFQDTIKLFIPFSKLSVAKLPAKGSEFSFQGNLKKEKADSLDPVWVIYGQGSDIGKVYVGVTLIDVKPLD